MSKPDNSELILGLDLGPNSIGWSLVRFENKSPVGIEALGVRVFEAGLAELEKDGKGKSRNAERRDARQARRRLERLNRRLIKLGGTLQRAGLLPIGNLKDPVSRHELFCESDIKLGSPYRLRARAISERLEPYELGRALYHICQRRGFKSGRLEDRDPDKEKGKVQTSISNIDKEMNDHGFATLGEYFAHLIESGSKVRSQYTSRKMYQDEFQKIWENQSQFLPHTLTPELTGSIFKAIFHQRPLKSQAQFIGDCELEAGRKRAPMDLLAAQRFRLLATVNNLRLTNKGTGEVRELSHEERSKLIDHLERFGDLTIKKNAKEIIGLKPREWEFTLEAGGETKIPGNRTAAKLADIFGPDRWRKLSDQEKQSAIDDIRSINKDETLRNRGLLRWQLSEDDARRFAAVQLESGYTSFSRQALAKLLPRLESGVALQTAIKDAYPDRWNRKGTLHKSLPPLDCKDMPDLRNPIVARTLSELRSVVNAIVARYGKPNIIRVELARDLRQSADQRKNTIKRNRANEEKRDMAREQIVTEAGVSEPKRSDILKAQLHEECGGICPYTGKAISFSAMYGEHPQFDIEHIIPLDRCLDDSYLNKTLCYAEENRKVKLCRTPWETYHGTKKWDEILGRVARFKGTAAREKLRRFEMEPAEVETLINEFTSRQLNDTRYASKLAKQYLGLLYGGANENGVDPSGKLRVQASSGAATAFFRNEWGLNAILCDGGSKSRDDHRHHAVDSVVIALTDGGSIKALSDAASRARVVGRRLFDKMQQPWPGFLDDVRSAIKQTVPSHRVDRLVRGSLHDQTFYGKPRIDGKGKSFCHQRVRVESLSEKDIPKIVDPAVRKAVELRLAECGGDPKSSFKEEKNHPFLIQSGRQIPIHSVHIRRNLRTVSVGEGIRTRYVSTGSNHHMEIVADVDTKGKDNKWEGHVISMLEAHRRKRAGEPIVKHDHGPGKRFVFSLSGEEVMELDTEDGGRRLFLFVTADANNGSIRWFPIQDARPRSKTSKAGLTGGPDRIRLLHCQKMVVTPLGEVRRAND